MGLIQRKDSKSLEEALALLQKTIFSFSMKVCGQRQDAEDTMQEVLLKSVPNLPRFDNAKALMVWLYKVAKNRCLMSRRKEQIRSKGRPLPRRIDARPPGIVKAIRQSRWDTRGF